MTMTNEQWERIKTTSLERATEQLKRNPIVPSPTLGGWIIQSGTNPNASYLVKPKWNKTERKGHPNKTKGQYWWLLTCSCPAQIDGFALCWHKSAVYLYWLHCAEVKRMEGVGPWMIEDGPPPPAEEPTTPVASTPEEAPTKGRTTRSTRPRGTAKTVAKPGASGDRSKRPKTH